MRRLCVCAALAAVFGFMVCGLASVALAGPSPSTAGSPPVRESAQQDLLTVVVPTSLPPVYEKRQDGRPTGFAVELLRNVAARAGFHLRFVLARDPGQAYRVLVRGDADVLPGIAVSEARAQTVDFTRPIESQPVYVYTRSGAPRRETLADLAGLRVAVLEGSLAASMAAATPGVRTHSVQSLPQALLDLVSGDVDAMLMQGPFVAQAARAAGLEDRLARGARPVTEVRSAIAVAPGRDDIRRRLDAALAIYRNSQDFHALYLRWHPAPPPTGLSPGLLWGFAGTLIALAGVLLLWRYVSVLGVNRRLVAALAARDQALADLRLNQERMEALLRLTRMGQSDTASVIDFALREGVRLTGSGLGCLFFLEDGEPVPGETHWLVEPVRVAAAGDAPPEAGTEIWAGCMRVGAPILDNAASGPVRRIMAAPLLEQGRVTAVLGVADKAAPYDEADLRQLQLFMAGLGHVLAARRDAESLRRARDYAEGLVEGANAMIVGVDVEGRVTVFNAAAEAATGYPRGEVLGRPWHGILLPEELAAEAAARFTDFMAGRASLPRHHEGPLRVKNGGLRRISWQNSLLRHDGGVLGILSFGIDVTGHREASAALRRLHLAIEQAAEGVLIADGAGVLLYANPALRRLAGLPEDWPSRPHTVYDLNLDLVEHHSSACSGDGQDASWRGTCVFTRA